MRFPSYLGWGGLLGTMLLAAWATAWFHFAPSPDDAIAKKEDTANLLAILLGQSIWAILFVFVLVGCSESPRLWGRGNSARTAGYDSPKYWLLSLGGIITLAVLMRVPFWLSAPVLSDDMYRYIWEGLLWEVNPFRYAPASAELASFRTEFAHVYPWINHPELPAIYPPGIQFLFVILTTMTTSVVGFKVAFGLLEIVAMLLMAHWLRTRRLPVQRLIMYAWNPLVVVETAGSGHFEFALIALTAGFFLLYRGGRGIPHRPIVASFLLGWAVLVKYLPFIIWPLVVMRRQPPPRRAARWAVPLAIIAIFAGYHARFHLFPAGGAELGVTDRVGYFGSLTEYQARWRHNDTIFTLLESGVAAWGWADWIDRETWGKPGWYEWVRKAAGFHPKARHETQLTKSIIAGLLLLIAGLLWLKKPPISPELFAYVLYGIVLLVTPILHPWYLLLLFPMFLLWPRWSWLALMILLPWSYLIGAPSITDAQTVAIKWAIFFPFYLLLGVELVAALALRLRR